MHGCHFAHYQKSHSCQLQGLSKSAESVSRLPCFDEDYDGKVMVVGDDEGNDLEDAARRMIMQMKLYSSDDNGDSNDLEDAARRMMMRIFLQ